MKVNINIYDNLQKEIKVNYGFMDSPFGEMLLMVSDGKICYLGFVNNNINNKEEVLNMAKQSFKNVKADFVQGNLQDIGKNIWTDNPQNILLIGTPFQIKVWQALLEIPMGRVISYEVLSKSVSGLSADRNYTRAVANSVAKNKISYIIPCHRVIAKNGSLHKYLWGTDLKRKILAHEGVNFYD
ncbi:MAG: methylated-DNA--[protein]-cysteine S-methyltransferase [Alphaproteobacteria bacterium]|nr:methylated-DNA--[protein]-cysteine S-methyltransferase [Alphaproteobacteria bacterium]